MTCSTGTPVRVVNYTGVNVRRISWCDGRDRIVVSTSRCGRDNPGSNPGHGRDAVRSL